MNPLVLLLVERGIQVAIVKNRQGEIVFDLNPQTKSGMYMSLLPDEDGSYQVTGRYNEVDRVESFKDLLGVFASRYMARADQSEFGNPVWIKLAEEMGVLVRQEATTVTYSYA